MRVEVFDQLWKRRQYGMALALYRRLKRPFFLSQRVARHYERAGKIGAAMKEYEHLISEYRRLRIPLPLPNSDELFRLGKFHSTRNPQKASRFLRLHLKPDPYGMDKPIRCERAARKILAALS
jgi:hypothetical protein